MNRRVTSTVLLFAVPLLLLAVIGFFTGSLALGILELSGLLVIWVAGTIIIWLPYKNTTG